MSGKGLSNNPKGRVKVANRMESHRAYFGALAEKKSLIPERPYSFEGNKIDSFPLLHRSGLFLRNH